MAIISGISERLANWYKGKYIPPPVNDPNSSIVIISPGYYEQPLLAKMFGAICRFYVSHWQWVWSTGIAALGLYVAVRALM